MVNAIRRTYALICMGLGFICACADQSYEITLQALQSYQNNQIQDALDALLQIHTHTPSVLFNLGACYSRLNKKREARIALKRAAYYGDASVYWRAQQLLHELEEHEPSLYSKARVYGIGIGKYFSLLSWQIVILLLWWLMLLGIMFLRNPYKILVTVFILILLTFTVIIWWVSYTYRNSQHGVMNTDTSLYLVPAEQLAYTTRVFKDDEVAVMAYDKHKKWYKIKIPNATGWVPYESIELITPLEDTL